MTSSVDLPLPKLAQQLAQKQAELETARQAYEKRLANLTRQKEELQAQLRTVETEIKAVSSAAGPGAGAAPPAGTPAAPSAPRGGDSPTLPGLLVDLVRKAGGPVTVKQLTEGVMRAKFRSTSHNLPRMVKNKIGVLVKRGLLRRAEGQPGVVLGKSPTGKRAQAARTAPSRKPTGGNGKPAALAKSAPMQGRGDLRKLLVQLLAESNRPLRAKELADQALAAGYQTASKDFINVVWDALGKIKEIKNVRGQGYRLKKRPAK